MSQVISFEDYQPPVRFDDVAWTQVQIVEALTATGTGTVIDTITFDVPDADPTNPQLRSFTTDAASDDPDLWYWAIFLDDDGNISLPTPAIRNTITPTSDHDLCTIADVQTYCPGYVPNDDTDAKLQQLITAESEQFAADAGFEFIAAEQSQPAVRLFTVFPGWEQRIYVGALASTDDLAVAVLDDQGNESVVDAADITPVYGARWQPTAGWQPITALEIRTPTLTTGQRVQVTGNWGYPSIPTMVREAVAATVLLRYASDVANAGTALSDALDNVNIRGLVSRRDDALVALKALRPPVVA